MISKWNWKVIGLVAAGIALAMFLPPVRALVLFILPLGSGVDDIVFILALIIATMVWGGRAWAAWKIRDDIRYAKKHLSPKTQAWILTCIVILISVSVAPTASPAWDAILMGKPIGDPATFFVCVAIECVLVAVIWFIFGSKRKEKKKDEISTH
jgi:hypothetical protein